MAVTTINLSDPISTLVTKTNTISTDLGDKATLNTTATTDLVTAINEINTKVVAIDTDAEIGAKVEAFFAGNQLDVGGINADSADFDSATITTLTSTTGTITTLTSTNGTIANATLGQVTADSASILSGVATLASAAITNATLTSATITNATLTTAEITTLNMESVDLDNIKPLQIYNSAGSVVLAGYLLSTSNTDGTL